LEEHPACQWHGVRISDRPAKFLVLSELSRPRIILMDPISLAVDKTEELLGHSPHPAIVTVPLGAWTVSNICDGLALATGDRAYDDAARISMAVGLVGAAAAAVTGLRDYSHIPKDRPSHGVATTHGLGNSLAASLVAASFVMRVKDHAAGRRTGVAARLLALTAGGISLYTAWLGGKLVEEMGEAVKPVMDRLSGEEQGEDGRGRERLDPTSPLGVHGS
jgi:uncharacterized membrane protein